MAYPLSEPVQFLGDKYSVAQQIETQNEEVANVYDTGLPLEERYLNALTAGDMVAQLRIMRGVDQADEIVDEQFDKSVSLTPFVIGLGIFCFIFPATPHGRIDEWVQIRDAAFHGLYEFESSRANFVQALGPAVLLSRSDLGFFFTGTPISGEAFATNFLNYNRLFDIGPGTTER